MQEGLDKYMIFRWVFDVKMGGLDKPQQACRIILLAKYEFSRNREIQRKLMPKDAPQTTQIDHFGSIGSDFRDLGAF